MIMAERIRTPMSYDPNIDELKEQDWWCYRDTGPLATHRDNQLVHDFTKDGTLFRLWNALRYEPKNKQLNLMMLEYLRWISKESTISGNMFQSIKLG